MPESVELAPVEPPARPSPTRCDPVATRQRWADRLARFRAAEQTVAAFCAADGVSVPAFAQWRRTLAADAPSPADGPAFVSVRIIAHRPMAVAVRGALEYPLDPAHLDALFDHSLGSQSDRGERRGSWWLFRPSDGRMSVGPKLPTAGTAPCHGPNSPPSNRRTPTPSGSG